MRHFLSVASFFAVMAAAVYVLDRILDRYDK